MKLKNIIYVAALTCSFQCAKAGESLLKNGDFAGKELKPWKLFATEKVEAPTAKLADGVVMITSTQVSKKVSNEQLAQKVEEIKSNTQYKLTFDAKSEDIKGILLVTLSRSKNWDKGHYGAYKKMQLTKEWETYIIKFKTKQIEEDNFPQLKFLFGHLKGDLSFRNVKLVEVKAKTKE